MVVAHLKDHQHHLWADYVMNHPHGSLYHLPEWKNCIERAYGHRTYCLMGVEERKHADPNDTDAPISGHEAHQPLTIRGIVPLVHIRHFLFGNSLISMPFCDLGGILADDEEAEETLLAGAIQLGYELKAARIELRHTRPLQCLEKLAHGRADGLNSEDPSRPHPKCTAVSDKVRLLLPLPDSSEVLMKSFRSKLRSQIKKPLKQGMTTRIGGLELLDDFYNVFLVNMRDLGSPVHSKKLVAAFLDEFSSKSRIVAVYKDGRPLAASVIVGFKDTLANPWASSLREYSSLSPNMLLYWSMLEYGCDNHFARFDFGRSSLHESTYKFKKQWGAEPQTLYWHHVALGGTSMENGRSEKDTYRMAIEYWKKLPVPVTKVLGPPLRRYIGL